MKHVFFISIYIALLLNLQAQDSLVVKLHPAKSYPWTILYQLKDVRQFYIDNKKQNKDSTFIYSLKGLPKGMYVLMYDMQPGHYVYFIYNNESIELDLFPRDSQIFKVSQSKENAIYLPYIDKQKALVNRLNILEDLKANNKLSNEDMLLFKDLKRQLNKLQQDYLSKSKDLLAHKYIKAMDEYYPDINLPSSAYFKEKSQNYLSNLDFNDKDLQHSNILIDKVNHYVFSINPPSNPKTKHLEYLNRIDTVIKRIEAISYKNNLIVSLTQSFIRVDGRVSKYLIEHYIKKMPEDFQYQIGLQNIIDQIGLTIGEQAPDFSFKNFNENGFQLKQIIPKKPYTLLVFWSSTCPHCLRAMPKIKDMFKERTDFNVVAIGLESEKYSWSEEQAKYPDFYHGIKLQKWQNPIVKLYGIHATPTFFIIDNQGQIIAQPYEVKDIEDWLKNHPFKK